MRRFVLVMAIPFLVLAGNAAADVVVFVDGTRMSVQKYEVKGNVVVITTRDGRLRSGDVPAAVEFGRVAAAPVNTLRQQTHRCQEISVCF